MLLTAVGIVLLASFLPHARQWVCAPVAIAGLVVAMALCAAQAGRETLTFSGVWALDGASVWGRLMVLGTAAAVCAFSPDWMRSDRRHGEYYAILLFS
ncbi:MAG: NADH-quinone oxidoreductase subunit N, partial [Notoacmeibacter sp.]|nr:NADH-quinone oxidoreductase subunit N [Notoacmeibacter sp.]